MPKPRVVPTASGSSGYTEDEKRVLNHTSNINDNIFVPFMDVDLKDRFVYSIPFTDKVSTILMVLFCIFERFSLICSCIFVLGWHARIGTKTEARLYRMVSCE